MGILTMVSWKSPRNRAVWSPKKPKQPGSFKIAHVYQRYNLKALIAKQTYSDLVT